VRWRGRGNSLASPGGLRLAERMRIERFDPKDDDVVRACHKVRLAAREVDDSLNPPESLATFTGWLRFGWHANPSEAWHLPDTETETDGPAGGFYRLELPDLENRDRAHVNVVVHPAARRHGIGRELLRHAAARATANGRSIVRSSALQGTAGAAFALAAGFTPGLVDERRLLDLRTVPDGHFARLREEAAAKAAGYALVTWTGPVPAEYLDRVAGVHNAMNDAPHAEGYEDDLWDARRVRERADAALLATAMRAYSLAALHDASGELAALTQVFVAPEFPAWADQGLTAVTRPHRGHRLGLLTKTAMLEWLAAAEPALERITTDNSASNAHMIGINEALGFRLAGPAGQIYQIPVAEIR
jgi:GNAT superfamily N-acetyltransferase